MTHDPITIFGLDPLGLIEDEHYRRTRTPSHDDTDDEED